MFSIFHLHDKKVLNKVIIIVLPCLLLLILTACKDPFEYRSTRISPHDYPGSEWQSDNPYIYCQVLDNRTIRGSILVNGELVEIQCTVDWGRYIIISKVDILKDNIEESDELLEGLCKCTEQQIVINIRKDNCFEGKYDSIILNRVESVPEK